MAQPAVQLFTLKHQNSNIQLDIEAIKNKFLSYEGSGRCADIKRDKRSFYTDNIESEIIGEDSFLSGYIHFGSYGMSQAHHDVVGTHSETPIPATNATTKPYFFMLRDSSRNPDCAYEYVLAMQLWGVESPLYSLKLEFLSEMGVIVQKLTNRERLINFIVNGKTSNATLVFSEMRQTNGDIPQLESCEFKLKGTEFMRLLEQAAIKKLRDPNSSEYIEIQDKVAEYFNQDAQYCSATKLEVKNSKRTKVVSFSKLDEGLHERFLLGDLFADGIEPRPEELNREFHSILEDI